MTQLIINDELQLGCLEKHRQDLFNIYLNMLRSQEKANALAEIEPKDLGEPTQQDHLADVKSQMKQLRYLMQDFLTQTEDYAYEDIAKQIGMSEVAWKVLFNQIVERYEMKTTFYQLTLNGHKKTSYYRIIVDSRKQKVLVYRSFSDGSYTCLGYLFHNTTILEPGEQSDHWTTLSLTDERELEDIKAMFKKLEDKIKLDPQQPLIPSPF